MPRRPPKPATGRRPRSTEETAGAFNSEVPVWIATGASKGGNLNDRAAAALVGTRG
jgi:hypothetical protein